MKMQNNKTHTYEIGGICVVMTEECAAAWNSGDMDRSMCEGAYVSIPMRSGVRSYVHNGEVVVNDGTPYEETMLLWDFIGGDAGDSKEYTQYMEGHKANRIRD